MKRLFIFVFFLTLLGCSKSNTQDDLPSTDAKISISQNSLLFDASGTEKSITVYSNSTWTLSGGEFWCKPSATKGENFDTIIFRSEENPNKTERKTEFIFTCGTATTKLVVTQKPAVDGNISLSENNLTFDVAGGEQSISVYSSTSWTLTGGESWCRPSAMSGSSFDSVIFKAEENVSPDERNAVFTFNCDNATAKLLITQKQADALTITSSKIEIGNAGGEVSVEVKANINFDYKIQDDCKEWVSYVTTRALTTSTLIFNVAPSEEAERRTGTISIFSGDKKEDVTIYQSGEHILVLTQNEYNISADGETIAVELKSNLDYTYEIPADAPWITKVDTRAISTHTCYLNIEPNTTLKNREAKIKFMDEDRCIEQQVIVCQEGIKQLVIENLTIGTLKERLVDFDVTRITDLKITGLMGDEDFKYINETLLNLVKLDIGDVKVMVLPRAIQNVQHLVLPKTLVIIKEGFGSHQKLVSIVIPASVKTIEKGAFSECYSLTTVIFDEDSQLETIEGGYYYLSNNFYGAFSSCTALTSICIPASVKKIEAGAFQNCSSLATVSFEKGSLLESIGGGFTNHYYDYVGAFADCKALVSIDIPASVKTIGSATFQNCIALKTVNFDINSQLNRIEGGHYFGGYDYHYGAFSNCTALTNICIPASVEYIGEAAFRNCTSLATVIFEKPSQLKEICGGYGSNRNADNALGAFSNCKSLTSITIPAGVKRIRPATFKNCSSLKEVCFESNSQLTEIEGGYAIGITDYGAFVNCSALTSICIPRLVKTIGATAFKNCNSLVNVTFEYNSQLQAIYGGDEYDLEYGAFGECRRLEIFDAENCTQLHQLGNSIFLNATYLRQFKLGTHEPPSLGNMTFEGVNNHVELKVPTASIEIYKRRDGWSNFNKITSLDD